MRIFAKLSWTILLVMSMVCSLEAGQTATFLKDRSKKSDPVTLGKWHPDFNKCKNYAVKHGVPMIAVWSNGDSCSHCTKFENACCSSTFKTWMKSSGIVFYFTYPGDGGDGKEGSSVFHWIRGENTSYPFVRIYWPKGKVDVMTVGDTVDGNVNGSSGGSNAVKYFKNKLKNYKYVPPTVVPKYTGGTFQVADGTQEAELGTTQAVDIPLARTNATVQASVSTNTVLVVYPSGNVLTNRIDWLKGDALTNVTVDVSAATGLSKVDERVAVILLDAAGKGVETNHITMVAEPENSPSNPRWIGERTEDSLTWGEWTMDIDVATNKVAAYNRGRATDRAHTLLLLEGALWCPDCMKTDENLLDREEFKTWAAENKLALVAIDLPRGSTTEATAASLLTDEPGGSYNKCGTPYLSRKHIDRDQALEILARNWRIAGSLRLPNWSNPIRPPVPSLFVLREDGSIAARMQYFGGVESPTAFDAALIKRLDEMLAHLDMPDEERNDNITWTPWTIGRAEEVSEQLSFVDSSDVWKIDAAECYGKRLHFSVSAAAGTQLKVDVISVSGTSEKTVVSACTNAYPIEVSADIASSNMFVKVSYPLDARGKALDPQFAVAKADSTVFPFTLKTDFVAQPTDVRDTIEVTDSSMMVSLVSNQLYKISGLGDNSTVLELVEGTEDVYRALETGDARLSLTGSSASLQTWNPGVVGFAVRSTSVSESSGVYTLKLVREGGVAGRAVVRLSTIAEKSTEFTDTVALPEGFGDELVWEEGDGEAKTITLKIVDNPFSDDNQTLCFAATVSGDAEAGTVEMLLTVRDNDKRVLGKIAISKTTPAFAKTMTVFARAGGTVLIDVAREGGADGEQKVNAIVSSGSLDATDLTWDSRDVAMRQVSLSLPSSGKSVTFELKPQSGSAVDSARRSLKVNLLAADVPGFETDAVKVDAVRYVPLATTEVAIDSAYVADWSKVKVSRYSGALPTGLKWKYDAESHKVVISGVPTAAGSGTVVLRVSEGTTAGLTCAVTVSVTDPTVEGAGEGGAAPLNEAVKTSRTFSELPVYDMTESRLIGLMTLTVPRTGRLSAKLRTVDATKAVSLSCASWQEIAADGTLTAEATGKIGSDVIGLLVTAKPDGSVDAVLDHPLRAGHDIVVEMPETVWTAVNPATDFQGYYTVQLPVTEAAERNLLASGCGYLTLKMNTASAVNKGTFTYAGVLPDGNALSGTTRLSAKDWLSDPDFLYWKRGLLPILNVSAQEKLSGALQIYPGAADPTAQSFDAELGVRTGRCYYKNIRRVIAPSDDIGGLVWNHIEKDASVTSEAKLGAYGCYYNASENFLTCCQQALGSGSLTFFALPGLNDLDEDVLGRLTFGAWQESPTNAVGGVSVTFAKATSKAKSKTSQIKSTNTTKVTLSFTLSTGIVSGSFTLPMASGKVKYTYRGVVMPGFGYSDCAACGIGAHVGGVEAAEMPFVGGTAWANDTLKYTDEKGKSRSVTVRRSTPFSVGVVPGE